MTLTGIILLLMAGFAQGSFGMGMKRQAPLSWESFWFIYSLAAMLIIPVLWGVCSSTSFFEAIFATSPDTLYRSILLGFLWGVGGIMFGISVNYVGVSITNGVVMGLAGGLGAIIPLLGIEGASESASFPYVIIGVSIMLVGVAMSAYSGILRDKEQHHAKVNQHLRKRDVATGLIFVVACGVLSSLLNVGFEAATPIVESARSLGASDASAALPARATVVFGGLITNLGYAILLLCKNRTWSDFSTISSGDARKSSLWAVVTGLLWFLPLGLSGIVAVSMGELGNVITWPVMLALSLIFGNIWGYLSGEWNGTKVSFALMSSAAVVLIIACVILTFKDMLPEL